jgi:predicted DCC family thiol-disulfide oxidoreductase YuxK
MAQITVYIDGNCPMCVAGALRFQRWDPAQALRFVNIHESPWSAQLAQRFAPKDAAGAMRAHLPDGTWRTGWFAWAAILATLPAWRGLGRVMQWPIFYGIGPDLYRLVAAYRQELSRALHLPPPCDENGVCRLGRN